MDLNRVKEKLEYFVLFFLSLNLMLISWSPIKVFTGLMTLIFLIYLFFCLFVSIKNSSFSFKEINFIDFGILVFVVGIIISCIFSINPRESFSYFEKLIFKPAILYAVIRIAVVNEKRFFLLFFSLIASYFAVFLLSLFRLIKIIFHKRWLFRFAGIFKTPTKFGKFIDLSMFPSVSILLYERNVLLIIIYFLFSFLSVIFLILSGTRGSWISFFLVFIFFTIWLTKSGSLIKRWLSFWILLVVLVSLSGLAVGNTGYLKGRLISLIKLKKSLKSEVSLQLRLKFYKTAWALFKERPLTGWGFGRKIPKLVKRRLGENWFKKRKLKPFRYHAHNTFLEIMFECGVIGLMCYLVFMLSVFLYAVKYINIKAAIGLIKACLFISVLSLWIHSLVTYYIQVPIIYMFFVHLAFLGCECAGEQKD